MDGIDKEFKIEDEETVMGDTYIPNSVLREKASPSKTEKLQKL